MNIKALALGTIAAVSTFVAPTPAGAYQVGYDCGHVGGYDACVSYQDRNDPDKIWVEGPYGTEFIEVSCYTGGGYAWESHGPNTREFADYIARSFCG